MPESVNLLVDSIATRFIAAAVAKSTNKVRPARTPLAQVSLLVNGVEVAFVPALEQLADEMAALTRPEALRMAEEMVMGAGLHDAVTELFNARMSVRKALHTVRDKTKDPDDYVERAT